MNAATPSGRVEPRGVSWSRIAWVAVPLLYFLSAAFHVYCGAMNADEGFYAIAARSVMEGDVPYRDFGYTQMPLLPYCNGPLLALTGYGLFEQRWLNAAWAALALGIAALWIGRRTRPTVALVAVGLFSVSPAWMHYTHLGKTYALTSLIAMLATWVFVTRPGGAGKQCLLGVLGVVGVGCRLPSAPLFAVLWIAALWHDGSFHWKRCAAGLSSIGAATLLVFGPFYVLAPAATHFWMFEFHALSVPYKLWRADFEEILGLAPVWWIGVAVVLLASAVKRRWLVSREAAVALAALAAFAANLLPRGVYVEYAVPFLLPLAGAVAIELYRYSQAWTARVRAVVIALLLLGQFAIIPGVAWARGRIGTFDTWAAWLPPNVAPYTPDLYARIGRARQIVEQVVPRNAPLLGPNIILAAETGRAVPRNARMGPFTLTDEFDAPTAQRLNLLTYSELHRWLADPHVPLLAFFTTPRANYAWSVPSFRLQPRDEAEKWLGVLRRDFLIVQQDPDFLLVARPSALPRGAMAPPP